MLQFSGSNSVWQCTVHDVQLLNSRLIELLMVLIHLLLLVTITLNFDMKVASQFVLCPHLRWYQTWKT